MATFWDLFWDCFQFAGNVLIAVISIGLRSAFWLLVVGLPCIVLVHCTAVACCWISRIELGYEAKAKFEQLPNWRRAIGMLFALILSLELVLTGNLLGGVPNLAWGQFEIAVLAQDYDLSAFQWVIGLVFGLVACLVLAVNEYTEPLLELLRVLFGKTIGQLLVGCIIISPFVGLFFPFAFRSVHDPVVAVAANFVNRTNGNFVPEELKGASFSGEVAIMTPETLANGMQQFKEMTIEFGVDLPMISINKLTYPCRIHDSKIYIDSWTNQGIYHEIEVYEGRQKVFFKSFFKNLTEQGVLVRDDLKVMTDSILLERILDPKSHGIGF